MHPIATTLRELRQQSSLTLADFADQCGLSHTTIMRYEKGDVSPTVEALEKIAKGTGKTLTISFGNLTTPAAVGNPFTEFRDALEKMKDKR